MFSHYATPKISSICKISTFCEDLSFLNPRSTFKNTENKAHVLIFFPQIISNSKRVLRIFVSILYLEAKMFKIEKCILNYACFKHPWVLQSWPKYMRQTLVLVWNSALREKFNINFWTVFRLHWRNFHFGRKTGH